MLTKLFLKLMQLNYSKKKEREENISILQDLIRTKEQELAKNPNNINCQTEIKILQEQLQNIIMEDYHKDTLRLLSQRYFEGADKPSKLLAGMIKKSWGKALITKLKTDSEEIVDHQIIKKKFVTFFEDLYRKKTSNVDEIKNYLGTF